MPLKLLIREEGGKHKQVKAPENRIRIVMYVCWEKKKNKNIWIPIDISEFCGWGQFPQYWPQEFARVIFMKSVWAQLVNDRTYICEGSWRKKQTSFHGRYKTAHRTWQCSHKNLGKVEREMVRETHKTVRGCCKSDLIFNLRFDKYQKRENFNVFRQMSWTGGLDLAGEW